MDGCNADVTVGGTHCRSTHPPVLPGYYNVPLPDSRAIKPSIRSFHSMTVRSNERRQSPTLQSYRNSSRFQCTRRRCPMIDHSPPPRQGHVKSVRGHRGVTSEGGAVSGRRRICHGVSCTAGVHCLLAAASQPETRATCM